jgi:hypothetical protein
MITDWRAFVNEATNVEEVFEMPKEIVSKNSGIKKANLIPCGLPSRQYEEEELGEPLCRDECFGCSYVGEDAAGATSSEEIIQLMDMMRKTIAKTSPISLARAVAVKYKKIQESVNQNLKSDQVPLPDWTEPTILEHLRYHINDPEINHWFTMFDLREMRKIALKASVVKNEDTGEMCMDEKQTKIYLELLKAEEIYYKSDPTKKLYYSGGKFIDPQTTSEGPIYYSGKNIYSYFGKKRKIN